MLIVVLIVAVLLVLIFGLRGEGSSYGNSINDNLKNKLKINDKNYFL